MSYTGLSYTGGTVTPKARQRRQEVQPSPQTTALRSLIEQREQEIAAVTEQRIRTLEGRVMELEEELGSQASEKAALQQRLDAMGSDYNHNLKTLEERNVEVERLEGVTEGLRNTAERREESFSTVRRRLQQLENDELGWKKSERDLKWKIEQLETKLREMAQQRGEEAQRMEAELIGKHRHLEEDLMQRKEELMVEKADLCREYERHLQHALMNEEELKATISRQHVELAEARSKGDRLEKKQRQYEQQSNDLHRVVVQFETTVAALQDMEAKYSELSTEHAHMKAQKQNKIQVQGGNTS